MVEKSEQACSFHKMWGTRQKLQMLSLWKVGWDEWNLAKLFQFTISENIQNF